MGRGGRDELGRRLLDTQLNQVERRTQRHVALVELKELRAIKFLGYRLFGEMAAIDFPIDTLTRRRTGPVRMGFWLEKQKFPRGHPGNVHRRAIWLFEASSHRELVEQVMVWQANRTGSG